MADQPLLTDSNGVLPQEQVNALMGQTKQQLVAQYPYLANNPDFNNDITTAFSQLVNQGVQVGSDYNDIYQRTVAPIVAKWTAKAGLDTAKLQENQELAALALAKQTRSPTAAVQAFPQLLAPNSKFRSEWVGRINKADEKPQIDTQKYRAELATLQKDYDNAQTPEDKATVRQQIANLKPTLLAQQTLNPSSTTASAPSPVINSSPMGFGGVVARPMGTSGYLNPNVPPALQPQGHIYMGAKLSPQAEAAMLAQWKAQSQPSPLPTSTAKAAQGGYKVGAVYKGGLKYLGGDPNDQASWQQT